MSNELTTVKYTVHLCFKQSATHSRHLPKLPLLLIPTVLNFGSRTASFKRPLLSVDVSVCLSATLMLNISETKPIRRFHFIYY